MNAIAEIEKFVGHTQNAALVLSRIERTPDDDIVYARMLKTLSRYDGIIGKQPQLDWENVDDWAPEGWDA